MYNKIIIINGPNINLLGEREQSQYGSITFDKLKENCLNKSKELNLSIDFCQSNVEGEIVDLIQESRKKFDGMIINAAAFTHTSVAIRDALSIFKFFTRFKSLVFSLIVFILPFIFIFIFFIFFIVYKRLMSNKIIIINGPNLNLL